MTTQEASSNQKKWSDLFDKTSSSSIQGQQDTTVIATIEIHHDAVPEKSQDQPAVQSSHSKNKNSEVQPDALRLAQFLYTVHLDTITKTITRSELERFFDSKINDDTRAELSKLGIGFSEVLYALAKGMKVVNVFRPMNKTEQEMGWHKPEEKYRIAHRESKKRHHAQSDGFTFVGKAPLPEIKAPQMEIKPVEKPVQKQVEAAPVAAKEITEPVHYQPDEHDGTLTDDQIIAEIKTIKVDMENHLCAIESLVPLHDDHADKITIIECNPCEVAKRVVEYHKHAKAELVQLLDTLQFELDTMKSRKVWLCEQLKN
jgi:hypothetical protein